MIKSILNRKYNLHWRLQTSDDKDILANSHSLRGRRNLFILHITLHCVVENNYDDVMISSMASQITSLTIIHSTVYSGTDERKHQSSASLVFVRGIHRGPVNSLHKWPVTRKMFPFDDVIMFCWESYSAYSFWLYKPRSYVGTVIRSTATKSVLFQIEMYQKTTP